MRHLVREDGAFASGSKPLNMPCIKSLNMKKLITT